EQVRLPDVSPTRPADIDLPPASLHGDHSNIFDERLRAVPRAARYSHLDLPRRFQPFEALLHFDAEVCALAQSETAELASDARLHRAHGLGVGVAGAHPQVAPDVRQLILAEAEQVDTLTSGDLHHRNTVFIGHLGNP